MKEAIALVAIAFITAAVLFSNAQAATLEDSVVACERGAESASEFHALAQLYGDLDFRQYQSDIDGALAEQGATQSYSRAIRTIAAYAWFARKDSVEDATGGYVAACLDGVEQRHMQEERRRRSLWKSL